MKGRDNSSFPRFFFFFVYLAILAVFIASPAAFAGPLVLDGGYTFVADGPVILKGPNAKQLALKRRYIRMNSSANFSLGSNNPSGIAFDGANMWVVSKNQDALDVLRANNGQKVIPDKDISTFCTWPNSLAYDGKNMWATCLGDNKVTVMDGITGDQTTSAAVSGPPVYILFDGEFMWVACDGVDTLNIINTNDYSVATKTFPSCGVSHLAYGMASDGTNIWVVNRNYCPVNVYRISTRNRVTSMSPDQGSNALDVEFDGVNMWITNLEHDQITILKASNGSHVTTLTTSDGVGNKPTYLFFDGFYMWVVNELDGDVSIFRAHDFQYMTTANVGTNPQRLAFDGANMWITVSDATNVVKR